MVGSCSLGSFSDYILRFQLLFLPHFSPSHAMSSALAVVYRLIWCNGFGSWFAFVASFPAHNSPSRLYIRFVDLFDTFIKHALGSHQSPLTFCG